MGFIMRGSNAVSRETTAWPQRLPQTRPCRGSEERNQGLCGRGMGLSYYLSGNWGSFIAQPVDRLSDSQSEERVGIRTHAYQNPL